MLEKIRLWTEYKVSWTFLTKLCGSVPADPALVKAWLDARKPNVRPPASRSINEIQEEVFSSIATEAEAAAAGEVEAEPSYLTFQRAVLDPKIGKQLVVRANTVRSHLKDCARVLSAQYIGSIEGERSFSTRVINGVYLDEYQYWLPILRPDGSPILEADDKQDKPVHVRGPRGEPISALKTFEWVEPARIDFKLKVLTAREGAIKARAKKDAAGNPIPARTLSSVAAEDLGILMTYGGVHGYAGERGDGEGRYTFTIEEIKD